MKTNVVVHTAALTNESAKHFLGEGSSVYVRVIKNNGNNSFLVSFGGGRFNIKSPLELKEGEAFLAKITLQNGKVVLMKENALLQVDKMALSKLIPYTETGSLNITPAIINYFKKLGLVPDEITLSVYEQMKALGFKFEKSDFDKARQIAAKFETKKKEAAVVAYLLLKKGLLSNEEEVRSILSDEEFLSHFTEPEIITKNTVESEFKSFFVNILKNADFNSKMGHLGILSIFNHLGFNFEEPKSNGNWIKIPFEFDYKSKENINSGNGFVELFISNVERELKNIVCHFNFNSAVYNFCLYVQKDSNGNLKCKKINYWSNTEEDFLQDLLLNEFEDCKISKLNADELSEFYTERTDIQTFNAQV